MEPWPKVSPDFLMLISSQQCDKWLNHYPNPLSLYRGYFPSDQFASHLHQVEQYSISNLCLASTNMKSWTVFIADTYVWPSFSVSWMLLTSMKPEIWNKRDNNSMQHRGGDIEEKRGHLFLVFLCSAELGPIHICITSVRKERDCWTLAWPYDLVHLLGSWTFVLPHGQKFSLYSGSATHSPGWPFYLSCFSAVIPSLTWNSIIMDTSSMKRSTQSWELSAVHLSCGKKPIKVILEYLYSAHCLFIST